MRFVKKAICKGQLQLNNIVIPVKVYLGTDKLALSGHLYHTADNGPIEENRVCTICGEESPEVFSAIQIDDKLVPITSDHRKALFERDMPVFKVLSAHKINEVGLLLTQQRLVPLALLEMKPDNSLPFVNYDEELFTNLLYRLAVKRRFLLLQLPANGMKRFAILLPSPEGIGQLYTLHYQEEVRSFDLPRASLDRNLNSVIDPILQTLDADFPMVVSGASITARIQKWIKSIQSGRNIGTDQPVEVKTNV
jgi:non-homologous end joining protein Ku